VTHQCLLLLHDLTSFMLLVSDWDTLGRREDDVVDEPPGVVHEHLSLLRGLEVVEDVVVEQRVLGVVGALDQLLGVLPGDWAEVAELGEARLHEASVVV